MSLTFNGVDIVFLDKVHATVLQALLPIAGEGEISRDRRLHALFNDLTCHIDPEVRRTPFYAPFPAPHYINTSLFQSNLPALSNGACTIVCSFPRGSPPEIGPF